MEVLDIETTVISLKLFLCTSHSSRFRSLPRNSCQGFAQELNELLGVPCLEHHAHDDRWGTNLLFFARFSAVVHPASVPSNLDSHLEKKRKKGNLKTPGHAVKSR